MAMNANMRFGGLGSTKSLRRNAGISALISALAAGCLLLAAAPSLAFGGMDTAGPVARHDTNLERWAKEQVARKMGAMRDGYDASENIHFITAADIRRGPPTLGQQRSNDPIIMMATLRYFSLDDEATMGAKASDDLREALPPHQARAPYSGAFTMAAR
jgi:ABC-type enterochelin transport system ATPase subunit